jgi:hypothetical protein
MSRTTVDCFGIAPERGPQAAADIEQEFIEHRPWQTQPLCHYADGTLSLTAINDFDPIGIALLDEFWDCLAAFVGEHGKMHIRSIEQVSR